MFSPTPKAEADAIMSRNGIETAEGLGPFLEAQVRREQVRYGHHRREAARYSGVSYSGMAPEPRRPLNDEELIARARQEQAFAEEWRAGPQSRFIAAVLAIEELGYLAEGEVARAAYNRGFSPLSRKPSAVEIGRAYHALCQVPSYAAEEARVALLEIAAEGRTPAALAAE